jgi:hypothetical protein
MSPPPCIVLAVAGWQKAVSNPYRNGRSKRASQTRAQLKTSDPSTNDDMFETNSRQFTCPTKVQNRESDSIRCHSSSRKNGGTTSKQAICGLSFTDLPCDANREAKDLLVVGHFGLLNSESLSFCFFQCFELSFLVDR